MLKRNNKFMTGVIVLVAVLAFSAIFWSSAFAGKTVKDTSIKLILKCEEVNSGGPVYIYNPNPDSLRIAAFTGNCLSGKSDSNGPSYIFNAKPVVSSALADIEVDCLPIQPEYAGPSYIYNPKPATTSELAENEDRCLPG
jgi:hypothetical protein